MLDKVVNSHNHWDRLEEVIVGVPYHLDYAEDVSFKLFFYLNLVQYQRKEGFNFKPTNEIKEEALEDLEGFLHVLDAENVIIKRPEVLTEVKMIKSPWWQSPMGHALMSRDPFIIIGDEILETPTMVRSRYFESDLYKEMFTDYFERGAKWTVAPKSRLLDRNFDYSYAIKNGYTGKIPDNCFCEIMFDGAQILRMGKDMFFNCSVENHRMGLKWLQRHLGNSYRIHEINITDNHIDGMVLPLKPGVLLVNRKVNFEQLPPMLQKWDIIWYEPMNTTNQSEKMLYLASASIGMNVLSIDEKRIVVQDIQTDLIKDLRKAGFEPIPCRWRHGQVLGGGFHCMTLDIRRQSKLESYFD